MSEMLCDDCCRTAGHKHTQPWRKPWLKRSSMSTSSITKDIVVARAGRNFVNGKQAFDLTHDNIDEIVANFDRLKKQVPLILAPEHLFGAKKSAIPASGWVEKMYRAGDEWHARVKLIGDAATYVANDQFRGVSIGTVMAHDMHGKPVGEALDHLLITNSPFFGGLNIAATGSGVGPAGDGVAVKYLTAAPCQPWRSGRKAYVRKFADGLVGLFQHKPDGSIECRGLALEDDSHAIVKLAAESLGVKGPKATATDGTRAAVSATRVAAAPIVPEARVVDKCSYPGCEDRLSAQERFGHMLCDQHIWSVRKCIVPGCEQTFSAPTNGNWACDQHARTPTPDEEYAKNPDASTYVAATRSAAAPSSGMLKGITPDRSAGFGTFVESTCDKCDKEFATQAAPLPIRTVCDDCLMKSH